MKLIIASNNKGKIKEIKEILSDFDLQILSQNEAGFSHVDAEENGDTLYENACIKARALDTDLPVLADDTGLFVDYLKGPGVYTARYAGENASDEANRHKMLEELDGIKMRDASFITCMVLKVGDEIYSVEGICPGKIAEEERGSQGFGYDSIFIPEGYDKTFAQLDDKTKNSISHRRKAIEKISRILEELLDGKSSSC